MGKTECELIQWFQQFDFAYECEFNYVAFDLEFSKFRCVFYLGLEFGVFEEGAGFFVVGCFGVEELINDINADHCFVWVKDYAT